LGQERGRTPPPGRSASCDSLRRGLLTKKKGEGKERKKSDEKESSSTGRGEGVETEGVFFQQKHPVERDRRKDLRSSKKRAGSELETWLSNPERGGGGSLKRGGTISFPCLPRKRVETPWKKDTLSMGRGDPSRKKKPAVCLEGTVN